MSFPAISIRSSIGAKIFAAFVAMALMLGALGAYGIYVLAEAGDIVADTYDRPLMAINFARSASQVFTEMDKELLRRSTLAPEAMAGIDDHIETLARSFADDLAVAEERALSGDEQGIIQEIRQLFQQWKELRQTQTAGAGDPRLDRLAEAIIQRFDVLTELTAEHAFVARRQGLSAISRFRYISLGAALFAFLLAAAITFLLANRIIRPLSVAAGIADRIAKGELNTPIPKGGKDETGILLRSMMVMQDSVRFMMERETAQRQSEIKERADMLQAVMDSIPDGLVILAEPQGAVFWNKGFLRLSGLTEEPTAGGAAELHGARLEDLLRPFGLAGVVLEPQVAGRERVVERTLADGRSLRFHMLRAGGGNELLWVSDATDRRRQEADRLALQERVLQTQKSDAIGAIVGTVAHDFNNLLTAIMGFASLSRAQLDLLMALPEKLPTDDPAANRVVRHVLDAAQSVGRTQRDIVDGATRGQRIVANLTEFAKARKGERAVSDVTATIREAEQLIAIALPSSVRLEIAGADEAAMANHDRVMLEQVLLNLCLNGAHALEGRPGRIRIRVQPVHTDGRRAEVLRAAGAGKPEGHSTVATDDGGWIHVWRGVIGQGRYVRIDVSDDGSGMDEARMSRIFETFFTTKPKGVGTGLGLASVASIMDSHGGAIHVRSRPGQGTTFSLFLHAASAVEAAGADKSTEASADVPPSPLRADLRKGARILVVDDEQSLAKLMELTLLDQGYVVERFTDPMLAVARLRRHPETVDLVVTDQTMPGMTGTMLAEQTALLRRDLPVLLCTGYSAEHIDDQQLPQGVHAVLRKPYKPADLAERVRRILAV